MSSPREAESLGGVTIRKLLQNTLVKTNHHVKFVSSTHLHHDSRSLVTHATVADIVSANNYLSQRGDGASPDCSLHVISMSTYTYFSNV